jgi:flavin-dependent dehydrogenase
MLVDSTVAVVGASTAGLHAAHALARHGRKVVVFDRANSRSAVLSPRSLIVTSAYVDRLGAVGADAIKARVDAFNLVADGFDTTVSIARPDLIIDRQPLAEELKRRCRNRGVDIRDGTPVHSASAHDSGVALLFPDGRRRVFQEVIAADGAHSRVAKSAGFARPPLVPLVQAVVTLPRDLPATHARVWFEPGITPYFIWLIPHSRSEGTLGIIGTPEMRNDLRETLDCFAAHQGYAIRGYQGALIPEYQRWIRVRRRLGGGYVSLVGDAAGHVKVSTVGGIVNGVWGADGVVDHVLGNKGRGRMTLLALRAELRLHGLIRSALNRFSLQDYTDLLRMLDQRSRRTLGEINRDDALRLMARLITRRPRFALLGLRALGGARPRPRGTVVSYPHGSRGAA